MYQFIESIQLKEGEIYHLTWHQKRVNETFRAHYPEDSILCLAEIIQAATLPQHGLFKLRIVYNANAFDLEIQSYQKRKIQSIELVDIHFDYPYKALDRTPINKVLNNAEADEVIFCKNGYLTDSSYANVVLFDGKNWVTPKTYLLNGTTRQRLICEGKIKVMDVSVEDLGKFQKIGFINALNDLGEQTFNLDIL